MRALRAAVISADPELRATTRSSDRLALTHEVELAPTDVGEAELQELETLGLDVILVHLSEEEPELGLRLAEYLVGAAPGRAVLVAGAPPSRELLVEAMRAGAEEWLEEPLTPDALATALDRIARRLPPPPTPEPQEGATILAFLGVKGGVGTTTIASSVAVGLRERSDASVLLLDLDFGLGDAALHLGRTPRFDVVDAIENLDRMDAGLLNSLVDEYRPGLHLLASPSRPERMAAVERGQVGRLLQLLRRHYRYVVVDSPHPFSDLTTEIVAEADHVLLVATPEVPALRNVRHVLPLLGDEEAASPRLEMVVNRYDSGRSVPVPEIERVVGVQVRDTVANDYPTATRLVNDGRPLMLADRAPVARDLARLSSALAGGPASSPRRAPGRRSMLRSLRRRGGDGRVDSGQRATPEHGGMNG